MDVTSDIVKARESIRNKYKLLNLGRIEGERVFAETFDPIIRPLEEIKKQTAAAAPALVQPKTEKSIAKPYLDLIKKSKGTTDQVYGLRPTSSGSFKIGSHPVKIDGDDLVIDNERYQGTQGLYELLVKKTPKHYTPEDLDSFKRILDQTSAHKSHYSPRGKIASNHSLKYKGIVKKIFEGSGLFKTLRRNVDYKYFDDPNELVDRLRLLIASREAGSSAHENEIIEIISELKELRLI